MHRGGATQTEPQPTEQIQELEGSDDEDEEDEEDELEFRRSWTAPARYNNYSGGNAIGLGPPPKPPFAYFGTYTPVFLNTTLSEN